MKILTIIGARPQFIKAAIVSRQLKKSNIQEILLHTGQHYDKNMSEIFFKEMKIPKPHYMLNINRMNHGAMTGRMIEIIEVVLLKEKPNYVLVYGDTNTTLAGALAAKKLNIGVIHVEAGLRSFNMSMPEEINRILTDRISDILFCPTDNAVDNLKDEGFDNYNCKVIKCGDVMEDSARFFSIIAKKKSHIIHKLQLEDKKYILCTIHRSENTDNPKRLKQLVKIINYLAKDFEIILPLHPRTKDRLKHEGLRLNINNISPVGYLDMISLLEQCSLVMTDSGGMQKEAYFFNKYCLTLRDETEWTELVKNGFNRIVGVDQKKVTQGVKDLISKKYKKMIQLYGGGKATKNIVKVLETL